MARIVNNRKRLENRRLLRKNQTKEEALLWDKIRNSKLHFKFRRQVSIGPYFVDFYCREKKLIIELDGIQHLENKIYDKERDLYMQTFGIKTLRIWNSEITNSKIEDTLAKIKTKLCD